MFVEELKIYLLAAPSYEISNQFLKELINLKLFLSEIFINLSESLKHHL